MKQDAIVSGILSHNGKVLLAKRPMTKTIAPGMYHLPGGHVECGEQPHEALEREFMEEFNLKVTAGDVVRAFAYQKDDLHTIGITYEVTCDDIPPIISFDTNDTEEVVWVDNDDYDTYMNKNPSGHDRIRFSQLTWNKRSL